MKNFYFKTYRLNFKKRGFTLVELLLYIAIAGTLLLGTSGFLAVMLQERIKGESIVEVEEQGRHVLQIMTQSIRNAEAITLPLVGTNGEVLTLDVVDVTNDPTLFDLSGGVIRITEGSNDPVPLTNSSITASDLLFQNLSRVGTPGIVRISFILSHKNPSGRQEYEFSKTFYISASLRQP